jgi:hypothetical protein
MLKNKILDELKDLNNERNRSIMKVVNKINCFKCLDTQRLWRDRDNLPFAALDGRGYYDLFNCNECRNGHWASCSWSNDIFLDNFRVYHLNNYDVHDRLTQMYKVSFSEKYKVLEENPIVEEPQNVVDKVIVHDNDVKNENNNNENDNENDNENKIPSWWICENNTLSQELDNVKLDIAVGKLADDVFNIIKAYGGDFISIAKAAKDLTLNLGLNLEKTNNTNESLHQIKNDDNTYTYISIKLEKKIDNVKTGIADRLGFAKDKISIESTYYLFKPKNSLAQNLCDEMMNKKITDKLEYLKNH